MWIDNLHREMFDSGQLECWIEAGVSGVTSNPTIFEKAIRKYGVRAFAASFDALMRQIADEERALAGSAPPPM